MTRLALAALVALTLAGPVSAQTTATAPAPAPARRAGQTPAPARPAAPAPAPAPAPAQPAAAAAAPAQSAPAPAAQSTAPAQSAAQVPASTTPPAAQVPAAALSAAQLPPPAPSAATQIPPPAQPASFPRVTFGVLSFLEYAAELHESDGYNAFDITRGYFNVRAQLTDSIGVRFTPDVRPVTDANLDRNLALRLEYASLDVKATDNLTIMFGLHETPWLTFEESLNRYRVLGPLFAERLLLIPGATDLGASLKYAGGVAEFHVGVYNGEGYGRAEIDKYKSIDSRATFRPFDEDSGLGKMSISGFYQYGWYARDRPRNVAIVMGSYESTHFVGTAQYLTATDNPFVAVDVKRRGLSTFVEGRQGRTGWAGLGGIDIFVPDAENDSDTRRRTTVGGAYWLQAGRGRLGVVTSLQQEYQTMNSQLLERRLLVQTHIEF